MAPEAVGTRPALVVHHLSDSRSQRILWLLEELEVPYEIKKYQRGPDHLAPKELLAVHPLGTAPVINDGDVTLAESGAIVAYVIGKYGDGRLIAPDSRTADDLFFSHYAEGTLMPLLVNKLVYGLVPERAPFILRPILRPVFKKLQDTFVDPRLEKQAAFIEEHLSKGGDWFAGEQGPTSADFMMSFPLESWVSEAPDVLGPKTREYVKRVHERPAYQRALTKGGEYAYAKAAL